jgi:hypothetical protein
MSDINGQMIQSAVSNSGLVDSLLIEKFTGKVHDAWLKTESLMERFDMQSVKGTNTISNKYLGETDLQTLTPGQDPPPTPTEFEKNALVVDAIVIGRNYVQQLHDVQNDIAGLKSKLVNKQTKKLRAMEDTMIIQQLLHGGLNNFESQDAGVDGGRVAPRVSGQGYSVKIVISDTQSEDPFSLVASIEECMEQMLIQEMDVEDVSCIMPWTYFNCLLDSAHVISKEYEILSGKTIDGFVLKSFNVPVVASNRFPKTLSSAEPSGHHLLSKATNGYRYDAVANSLLGVAVLYTPEALLLGYTLELQSDVWQDKATKGYFIDTWLSEGAIPDRWEATGIVLRGGSDNARITTRANRKAMITRTIT